MPQAAMLHHVMPLHATRLRAIHRHATRPHVMPRHKL